MSITVAKGMCLLMKIGAMNMKVDNINVILRSIIPIDFWRKDKMHIWEEGLEMNWNAMKMDCTKQSIGNN
jgi:hypothetical protein